MTEANPALAAFPATTTDAEPPVVRTLQPGTGETSGDHYLPATVDTVMWGRLPCAADDAVLSMRPGESVTIDTVSHEGLLEDQGSDPVAFFRGHGVAASDVLDDAVAIAAQVSREADVDGPHVITGPIYVEEASPGDLLKVTVVRLQPRVGYGVISNRHGKGALAGELPRGSLNVSVFAPVVRRDGALRGLIPLTAGGDRAAVFPLAPFLGTMGVAVSGSERT